MVDSEREICWRNLICHLLVAQWILFFASKIRALEYHADHPLWMTIPSDTRYLMKRFVPSAFPIKHSPSTHNDKHSCLWPSGSIPVFGIACFLHSSQLDDDVYIVSWVKSGWKLGAEGPLFVCIPFKALVIGCRRTVLSIDVSFHRYLGRLYRLTLIVFSFILS